MAFPTIIEDHAEFPVPESGRSLDGLADRYLSAFASHIQTHKPKEFFRSGDTVSFSGGMLRWVSKMNLLIPVRQGTVTATLAPGTLRVVYSLDMTFHAYVNAIFIPLFTWIWIEQGLGIAPGLALGIGVFSLSTASNWWWVHWRFRRIVHRAWEDARPRIQQDIGFSALKK